MQLHNNVGLVDYKNTYMGRLRSLHEVSPRPWGLLACHTMSSEPCFVAGNNSNTCCDVFCQTHSH